MTRKTIATPAGQPSLHVDMSEEELTILLEDESKFLAEQQAIADSYITKRVNEYPPIEEQLDMLYKDIVNGTATWTNKITEIKTKYPKN